MAKSNAIRCAIYTCKSTEEGLEQEFNSLDAQRESAEAFITSQKSEGWECLPDRYDDGGYSGGNTDRPAFQQLMSDVQAGKVDCIVVYKIDRLSRSLMDFARIMETLERCGVSLVSVTQQFNTTTSMGRLTLNILLSFAQFEREIISERTRDKMTAARRKGKWTGGRPVLGYDVDPKGGKLLVNEDEAARCCAAARGTSSAIRFPSGGRLSASRTARRLSLRPRKARLQGDGDDGPRRLRLPPRCQRPREHGLGRAHGAGLPVGASVALPRI